MFEKINNFLKNNQSDIILIVGVILISLLSFAMGYIMAKQQEKEPIKFELNEYKNLAFGENLVSINFHCVQIYENSNNRGGNMRLISCLEII